MDWILQDYLIEGEFDNRILGRVYGWLRFARLRERVRLELRGDFHRDIRGMLVRVRGRLGLLPLRGYFDRFGLEQRGEAGAMTIGLAPIAIDHPYFAWRGQNGHVVIELCWDDVFVVGKPRTDELPPDRVRQPALVDELNAGIAAAISEPRKRGGV